MKIPQVLAETQIGVVNQPQASPEAYAAPSEALVQAGRAGQSLAHMSFQIAYIENQKQQEQARDDALNRFTTAAGETQRILEQGKLDASDDNPYGVPTGEAPSKTYVHRVGTAYDELAKTAIQSAPDNSTKLYLNRSLLKLKATALTQAQRDSWNMFRDEQVATVPTELERFRRLIISAPDFRNVLEDERDTYLDSLRNLMPGKAIAELKIKERDKTLTGLAQRAIDSEPFQQVLPALQADLSPESYQSLTHYQETRQRMTISALNQLNNQLEKDGERIRHETLTDFTAQVDTARRSGQDTKTLWTQLDTLRQQRAIKTPAEYAHFSKLINEAKDAPSDPAIWSRVVQNVWREDPTMNAGQLRALMDEHTAGRPGLSVTNGKEALAHLDAVKRRQTTESDTEEARWYRRAEDQAKSAEQIAQARLGITTPLEQVSDPVTKKLWADFILDFRSRTDYYVTKPGERPHGEPAHQVLLDILPRFMAAQGDSTVNTYARMETLIDRHVIGDPPDPKTPQWVTWAKEASNRIEAIKATDPNLYLQQKAQMLNLNRARTEIIRQMTRQIQALPGGSSAPAAGGGYKPPSSHLQRPKE